MTVPRVTDHAVVRFLQRVKGVDIEAIRVEIAQTCASAVKAGASCVRAHGVKFEIDPKTRTVVTVAPGCQGASRTHRIRCAQGLAALPAHAGEGEY